MTLLSNIQANSQFEQGMVGYEIGPNATASIETLSNGRKVLQVKNTGVEGCYGQKYYFKNSSETDVWIQGWVKTKAAVSPPSNMGAWLNGDWHINGSGNDFTHFSYSVTGGDDQFGYAHFQASDSVWKPIRWHAKRPSNMVAFVPFMMINPQGNGELVAQFSDIEVYVGTGSDTIPDLPAAPDSGVTPPSSCTVFKADNGTLTYSCNDDLALVFPVSGCAQKIVSQSYSNGIITLQVIGCEAKPTNYWTETVDVTTNKESGWTYGDLICQAGYHYDVASAACVADVVLPPSKSFGARTIGPLGIPACLLHELWILRERYISKEVHKKLHPLV